jgi:catechol 2,3-dioxygenase-like lactoylglutathione lyase family enzyme
VYLSYFGIRVRDPVRAARFYSEVFGLKIVTPDDWRRVPEKTEARVVLMRDPESGQRLELNYYPEGNPYGTPYIPGEELDHLAFHVDHLDDLLKTLEGWNLRPERMKHYEGAIHDAPGYRVAYVRDPDGVQLELFETMRGQKPQFKHEKY